MFLDHFNENCDKRVIKNNFVLKLSQYRRERLADRTTHRVSFSSDLTVKKGTLGAGTNRLFSGATSAGKLQRQVDWRILIILGKNAISR